jgi:hypothetical protein
VSTLILVLKSILPLLSFLRENKRYQEGFSKDLLFWMLLISVACNLFSYFAMATVETALIKYKNNNEELQRQVVVIAERTPVTTPVLVDQQEIVTLIQSLQKTIESLKQTNPDNCYLQFPPMEQNTISDKIENLRKMENTDHETSTVNF